MKKGQTLVEMAQELERQKETKRDFVAPTSKVKLVRVPQEITADEGDALSMEHRLRLENVGTFGITKHTHGQIANFTGVPKQYYDRMLREQPDLLSRNVNTWLEAEEKGRMVRTLDGDARAFLSNRYRPLDNFDLMETILPTLTQTPGLTVESCQVTETRLYIKAVTDKITHEIQPGNHKFVPEGQRDIVQAGIVITNSEIGAGSLRIEPLLFFLACLNGLIVMDASMRKYHVGRSTSIENASEFFKDETRQMDDAAFWMKVRDTVAGSFNQIDFERLVKRVNDTAENRLDDNVDPTKVIEVTAKQFTLTEAESTGVLTEFLKRGEMSQYGISSAITRHSQDVEDYDRATELERIGGKVIELSQTDWKSIAQVAA